MIILAIVMPLVAALFIWHETKSIVITRYEIETDSEDKTPVRILHVSDLQSRYFGKAQKNLIEKARQTRPDIIVITGDLIDRNYTDYNAAKIATQALAKIAPVFYVDGNHETALDSMRYASFIKDASEYMSILFDRCERFECRGRVFNIGGLQEDTVNRSREYDRRNRNYDKELLINTIDGIFSDFCSGPKILLSHEPQLVDVYEKSSYDIVFSGHAHGGQFRIPFTKQGLYAPEQGVFPRYTEGIHKCGKSKMVISRGLGNSTFPFRLFNRPELVVVDLK